MDHKLSTHAALKPYGSNRTILVSREGSTVATFSDLLPADEKEKEKKVTVTWHEEAVRRLSYPSPVGHGDPFQADYGRGCEHVHWH